MWDQVFQLLELLTPDQWAALRGVLGVFSAIVVLTKLITAPIEWLRIKIRAKTVERALGAELFPNIEASLRYYISPYCQNIDPMRTAEPGDYRQRTELFIDLDNFAQERTETKYLLLLADSGMGKTSALLNYYNRHFSLFRATRPIALLPLSVPDVVERIKRIAAKPQTILLLDAFDEDPAAVQDYSQRLQTVLEAAQDFHRIIISCRTQFFPNDEAIPVETGILKVGPRKAGETAQYTFHTLYLSPFVPTQIEAYINQRFPWWRRAVPRQLAQKIPHLARRPMLLAHIEDLVQTDIEYSFELYEDMVQAWLKRESGSVGDIDQLRRFSEQLAVNLSLHATERGGEHIHTNELPAFAAGLGINLPSWRLRTRSLLNRTADGHYKFAHRSILEYLLAVRILAGDQQCAALRWSDQLLTFLWEICEAQVKRENQTPFQQQPQLAHDESMQRQMILLITHGCELLQNPNLEFDRREEILHTATLLLAAVLDPGQHRNLCLTLFRVQKNRQHPISTCEANKLIRYDVNPHARTTTAAPRNWVDFVPPDAPDYLTIVKRLKVADEDMLNATFSLPIKVNDHAGALLVGRSPSRDFFLRNEHLVVLPALQALHRSLQGDDSTDAPAVQRAIA
jgi:hypothetical protein